MRPANVISAATNLLPIIIATVSGSPSATLANGIVVGTTTSLLGATQTVNKYLGIPYAQSPPGRFQPPVPATTWTAARNATQFGPQCYQQSSALTQFNLSQDIISESEDCLYLNVFQPGTRAPGKGWPVMLWIHGGGLVFGSSSLPTYDGSRFAAYESIVLVTFNYRLGVFGFPGAPGIANLGFLDQRQAVQWVQENIAAFDGDPTKVTIFGESSGSISVDAILTAPQQVKGFRAAIVQSGTILSNSLASLAQIPSWQKLAEHFECSAENTVECLRRVPATNLAGYASEISFSAIITNDNITYTTKSGNQRATNKAAKVPVLIGTTADEGTIFTYGMKNLSAFISETFGALPMLIPNVTQAYTVGMPGIVNDTQAINRIFTEVGVQCPTALLANQTTSSGSLTYRYIYNATFANISPVPELGAFHSSELPMIFSTYNTTSATAQQYALSNYLRGAWARFARNPIAGPGWGSVSFDQFEGKDIAIIGTGGVAGVTLASSHEVDARCIMYEPVYRLLS